MVEFVNAKLNLGLDIIRKREDGYHDLSTLFYPVGLYNGTPENPEPFCDVLEINPTDALENEYHFTGNRIDCPLGKNLVVRATVLFQEELKMRNGRNIQKYNISLEKHIPDGAGLGGGSADASFTLQLLNKIEGEPFNSEELIAMAAKLGADCPFFIINKPVIATGIGEKMTPVELNLDGYWAILVKPAIYISTREAFSNILPREPEVDISEIIGYPIEEWESRGLKNDFERGIFANHPELASIKDHLKSLGAVYSAMSGSGSTIFGIFPDQETALKSIGSLRCRSSETSYITLCKL